MSCDDCRGQCSEHSGLVVEIQHLKRDQAEGFRAVRQSIRWLAIGVFFLATVVGVVNLLEQAFDEPLPRIAAGIDHE